MSDIVFREVQTRDLWQSIPFELAMSVLAVCLAAGLKIVGWMP